MGIPWPVAFGTRGGRVAELWPSNPAVAMQPRIENSLRFFFIEFITVYLAPMVKPSHPYNILPCQQKNPLYRKIHASQII
jgi:hypothetical protein